MDKIEYAIVYRPEEVREECCVIIKRDGGFNFSGRIALPNDKYCFQLHPPAKAKR
jgi:hypothetical protein